MEVHQEVLHLSGEDERLSVSPDAEFRLAVPQEVAKVDMEKLASIVLQHVVARMTVPDAEDIGGNGLPCERLQVALVVFGQLGFEIFFVLELEDQLLPLDGLQEVLHNALLVVRAEKSGA